MTRTGSGRTLRELRDLSPLRKGMALVVQSGRGKIAEAGSHEALIENAGVYASLFETQARHYR